MDFDSTFTSKLEPYQRVKECYQLFFVLNEDSWSANVKKSDRHTEEQRMLSLQDSKLPFIFCLLTSLLVWVILLAQWTKVMGEDIWGN